MYVKGIAEKFKPKLTQPSVIIIDTYLLIVWHFPNQHFGYKSLLYLIKRYRLFP